MLSLALVSRDNTHEQLYKYNLSVCAIHQNKITEGMNIVDRVCALEDEMGRIQSEIQGRLMIAHNTKCIKEHKYEVRAKLISTAKACEVVLESKLEVPKVEWHSKFKFLSIFVLESK